MAPDHVYVPGLDRPVIVSEYATLKGVREAEVFAGIRALKIPSAFFRGQWYVEAPPNTEARLAQLRTDKAETRKEGGVADWVAVVNQSRARVRPPAPEQRGSRLSEPPRRDPISPAPEQRGSRLSEPPRRDPISPAPEQRGSRLSELPRRDPINEQKDDESEQPPQVRREQQAHDTREKANAGESEIERLRVQFVKSHWRYDRLAPAQQEALLNTTKYAERPQPVDYGLSRYDLLCHRYALNDDLKYREEQSHEWRWIVGVAFIIYACACGGMLYLHDSGQLKGTSSQIWELGLVLAPASLFGSIMLFNMTEGFVNAYRRRRSEPGYLRYEEALGLHQLYQTTAQGAAHEAEQVILRKKRSYWAFLDGYAFERATAEVLKQHQFNPIVTPGSADGGIDIDVTRNGLKGVVQCKAHVASVGPHVVRDLYGVIHHCGASFGIIVSRGGFTRGAHDFRRDKPILFLDTDDLIAMQEGKDVLAAAFSGSSSGTRS
jgi:hypothetical protein